MEIQHEVGCMGDCCARGGARIADHHPGDGARESRGAVRVARGDRGGLRAVPTGPARYAEGSAEPAVEGSALMAALLGWKARETIAAGLMLLVGLLIIAHCAGCFPVDKQIEAAGGYEAQQMRCVDHYANRVDIDRCRDRVKAAWATDAGKD